MGAEHCSYDELGGRVTRLEQTGGRVLRLGQTWEVVDWKIADLGSCHLGKYLGENSLGKYLTSLFRGVK